MSHHRTSRGLQRQAAGGRVEGEGRGESFIWVIVVGFIYVYFFSY